MQTTIYFVRHGDVHNPENIWYGRLPRYRLSKKGRKQIEQTANFLLPQNIDFIYTSPLLRARQTAQIISEKMHLPIHLSKKLLETHSSLQGQSFTYLHSIQFDVYASSTNKIVGETLDELGDRMRSFIKDIVRKHAGKKVLAVSHGDPIMAVNVLANNLPINNSTMHDRTNYVTHGEVVIITYDADSPIKIARIFKPQ